MEEDKLTEDNLNECVDDGEEKEEPSLPEGLALTKNFTMMWLYNTFTKVGIVVSASIFLILLEQSLLLLWTVFIMSIVFFGHNIYILNRTPRLAVLTEEGLYLQTLHGVETVAYENVESVSFNWLGLRHEVKLKDGREVFLYPKRLEIKVFLEALKEKIQS